jgi:hypothetical protein
LNKKLFLQVSAGYRDIFITGFVVCLIKCGSNFGSHFLFEIFPALIYSHSGYNETNFYGVADFRSLATFIPF